MSDNDFGFKVSLPGYDAPTAPDQSLYASSSWPLIKIDQDLSGTLTLDSVTGNETITHNLGYPPLIFIWSHIGGFAPAFISGINSQTVTLSGAPSDEIQYYICRNPLNINYLAPNINIAGSGSGQKNGNFGLKFAKPGKDIDSTDYRDFTIHSGTKSLQVHQVIYQPLAQFSDINFGLPDFPNNLGLKYVTELPYDPVYFAFYSSDNENFIPITATSQVTPKIEYNPVDGGIIIFNGTSPGWGVFYVLLDPYQSTDQVNVVL